MIPDPDKITPTAAAKLLGVSRAALHLMMERKALPREVVAGRVFTSLKAVKGYEVDAKNQRSGRGEKSS